VPCQGQNKNVPPGQRKSVPVRDLSIGYIFIIKIGCLILLSPAAHKYLARLKMYHQGGQKCTSDRPYYWTYCVSRLVA